MKKVLRIFKIVGISFAILLFVLALILRIYYGGGKYYEDLSSTPIFTEKQLEIFFTFDEPFGNLAVSADERVFFTVHPESRPTQNKVMEIKKGKAIPFPNVEFQKKFDAVLGIRIDRQNRLWTIDHGQHGSKKVKLLAFDLKTNQLVHEYTFPRDIAEGGSFFNDFAVAPDGNTIYIADVSFFRKNPAIVMYDIKSGKSRRLLEVHKSVYPQDWIIRNKVRTMTFLGGLIALKPGIDGITIDYQGDYVYYAAMTHDGLYRIKTTHLKNEHLTPDGLYSKVERVGKKPLSDGISIDSAQNIYMTDVEHGAILRSDLKGKLTTLIKSDKIRWADGISFGGNGEWIYFTDSAIPDQMLQSKQHIQSAARLNAL